MVLYYKLELLQSVCAHGVFGNLRDKCFKIIQMVISNIGLKLESTFITHWHCFIHAILKDKT